MKNKNSMAQLREDFMDIKIPKNGLKKMEQAIERAKLEKARRRKMKTIKGFGIGLAASLSLFVIVPNVSSTAAMAMNKLPIIGELVEVVTFGRYHFEDENHIANVKIPQIDSTQNTGTGIEKVNKSVEEYTAMLIKEFEQQMEANKEGHSGLDISYEVVTDTEAWFTLKIDVLETMASAAQSAKYYHIDKTTGEVVTLKDIFKEDANYVTLLSETIKTQMKERMEADNNMLYFLNGENFETDFKQIKAEQNFYFDISGDLVIVFDEYEVAPGYMGSQEFTIPHNILASILKQ